MVERNTKSKRSGHCYFRDGLAYGISTLIAANKDLIRKDPEESYVSDSEDDDAVLEENDKIKYMHVVLTNIPQEADMSKNDAK